MDLQSAVDVLYDAPPAEFTRLRTEQIAAAKQAGDHPLADEIKALRRPSVSAWLVNVLVRRRGDDVDALLSMGEKLRDAPNLAGDELRTLLGKRRDCEAQLLDAARQLAAEHHVNATPAALGEVRASLEAGLADPDAADVVRSGQLVKPLGYGSFAEAMATAVGPRKATSRPTRGASKPTSKAGQQRAAASPAKLKAAKDAVAKAERLAAAARAKVEKAQRRSEEAEAHADGVRKDVADLQRFLRNREADLKMAERNVATAAKAREDAVRKADELDRQAEAARSALTELA